MKPCLQKSLHCRTMWAMHEIRYFDNAATTSISAAALDAYTKAVEHYRGNPSSLHQEGREAKAFLQQTREDLAGLLGVDAAALTFTSGATEANAIIISSLIWKERKGQIILSGIEHPSVSEYARLLKQLGWKVTVLPAPRGFIQKEDLQRALSSETRMVSIMLVNNITGSIQDVGGLVEVVRTFEAGHNNRKIHFHTDATQALGKIGFDLKNMGVDSAAFSAHKLHGPRGVGMLYNTNAGIESLSRGGAQEQGLRPGTENLGGIAAMHQAIKDAFSNLEENFKQVSSLNRFLRDRLALLPVLSPPENCSPYILTLSHPTLPSEVFTRLLFDQGFCVSSGSACSNNAKQKSQGVLSAMAFSPQLAKNSIRISLSKDTTEDDVEALAQTITHLNLEHA